MVKTRYRALALALMGSSMVAGCGVQGSATAPVSTPASGTASASPTTEESSTSPSPTIASNSLAQASHPAATFHNASAKQMAQWADAGVLYQLVGSDSRSTPGITGTILVVPTFHIPATIHHWPSNRFQAIAAINNPGLQLGTGTGTLWNDMSHSMYWLNLSSTLTLPTKINVSQSPTALDTVSGSLFGVVWPDVSHPYRVLFLKSRQTLVPNAVTTWPSHQFKIVAVIKRSVIPRYPWWLKLRMLNIAPGVEVTLP